MIATPLGTLGSVRWSLNTALAASTAYVRGLAAATARSAAGRKAAHAGDRLQQRGEQDQVEDRLEQADHHQGGVAHGDGHVPPEDEPGVANGGHAARAPSEN